MKLLSKLNVSHEIRDYLYPFFYDKNPEKSLKDIVAEHLYDGIANYGVFQIYFDDIYADYDCDSDEWFQYKSKGVYEDIILDQPFAQIVDEWLRTDTWLHIVTNRDSRGVITDIHVTLATIEPIEVL